MKEGPILPLVLVLLVFFAFSGLSDGFSLSRSLVMRSSPLLPPRKSSAIETGTTKKMKKKSYDIPGYIRGDLPLLQSVFEAHSLREKLSFDSFVKSRYLRFWPGRKAEVETIWMEITSSTSIHPPNNNNNQEKTEMITSSIHIDQLPELLKRLDEISYQMEKEMEDERVEWEVQTLTLDMLENYFEKHHRGHKLSFNDFLSFEHVQAEIWYNDKGLTEITQIWEQIAGCISNSIDKATFMKIYQTVCAAQYRLH